MNPHKMNKVDISSMSEQDQKAFKMYGKLPQKNLLTKMQKDRKYFDSGDYMMQKAGVASAQIGTTIPTADKVPHASPPTNGQGLGSSPTNSIPVPSPSHESGSPTEPRLERHVSVGQGISPASSDAIDMPAGSVGHRRRGSESQSRTSPPGTLRDHPNPSSSFVISHGERGGLGSSPVKASSLANRVDEEM